MGGWTADSTRSLGDLLTARRRAQFVGREGEVELFRSALAAEDPPFRVLFVHGPGGVGKSSLLDAYAAAAEAGGAEVLRLDGREGGGPRAIEDAVSALVGGAHREGTEDSPATGLQVLLVDGFEWWAPMESWVRDELLPTLPASTLTVIAGRDRPTAAWRTDGAWSGLLRVVSLRNLEPVAARSYLTDRGVPEGRHDEVLALTHSHPLALSLVADVLGDDPDLDLGAMPPEPMREILERMISVVPSAVHLDGLRAAAIARRATQDLLAEVLDARERAAEVFDWLSGLAVTEVGADGVRLHDLVRDLIDADLRWRDPPAYRTVFRAVNAHAVARASETRGREQQRAVADAKFLFRHVRGVLSPVAWERWGEHYPDRAGPGDRDPIVELVRRAEGPESAALAERWLALQPDGFHVIRSADRSLRGVVALLDLTAAEHADRMADPGTAAAWRFAEANTPARQGDTVTQCRFIVDAELYQEPSPTLNAVPIITLQNQLVDRRLSWDFLTLADPDRWNSYFAVAGLPRAGGADFSLGGRRYGLFAHDFRRVPIEVVTQRWTDVALADDALLLPPPDAPVETLVLAHSDFDSAARQALRDLRRPDLLGRNPLVRARLVGHVDEAERGVALESMVREAVGSLAQDPRDDRLFRAVERTYVSAAGTQEAAAAMLGLPFSTYRRHLRQGCDRVVAWLWSRELGEG